MIFLRAFLISLVLLTTGCTTIYYRGAFYSTLGTNRNIQTTVDPETGRMDFKYNTDVSPGIEAVHALERIAGTKGIP
jgi:hypothetical protein